jgi:molybdopterin-synthase adenylyltransferase
MTLSDEERGIYEWQSWVPGMGMAGQQRLKGATVLVSRVGGVGGLVAYELAAAGVGRLVLAHAGVVKRSDLNRQLLMTHAAIGTERIESAPMRLQELNPHVEVVSVPENVNPANAERLVGMADVVACCAPLFEERFALNEQCVRQNKPMVDAAMYELTGQLTTILPGKTACLACRVPERPPDWTREFPVFGAVAGAVGCLAAMEVIKLVTGLGEPLAGRLLTFDLRDVRFRTYRVARRADCAVCGPQ